MNAVRALVSGGMSLRKSLQLAGCSRMMYYYDPTKRFVQPDMKVVEAVKTLTLERPFYGTRRVAAVLSRELGDPVNRKQIQRIFDYLGWSEPSKTKAEIIRSSHPMPEPTRPNELWQADMTYIWCGKDGWCYLFNVLDVFTRRWLAYVFSPSAVKENAVASVEDALIAERPEVPQMLRTDNGPQYGSNAFMGAMEAFGIHHDFIAKNTPEQNGHIESFHKTLKKEYVWVRDFQSFQEAEEAIGEAFIDYNQWRVHSALGYLTPLGYALEQKVRINA